MIFSSGILDRPKFQASLTAAILMQGLAAPFVFAQRNFAANINLLAGASCTITRWSAKNDSGEKFVISQIAVPLRFDFELNERVGLSLKTIAASSALEARHNAGQRLTLAGFSDLKVESIVLLGNEGWLLKGGLNVPFGKESLSARELVVANAIAEDALAFPLGLYGAAFEAHAGILRAWHVGKLAMSGGVSYFFRDSFDYLEDVGAVKLDPGDEFAATVGMDLDVAHGKTSLDAHLIHRGSERLNSTTIVDAGSLLLMEASTFLKRYPLKASFWLRNYWNFGQGLRSAVAQNPALRSDSNRNPYQLELGGTLDHHLAPLTLQYGFDLRRFSPNEAGNEDALVWGGGAAVQFTPMEALAVRCALKYYTGALKSNGATFDLTGTQLSLGIFGAF